MVAAAGEGKPISTSSSFTIPEIVIECCDTPDDLFDPFKHDLWLIHDQTDPDSFISSDEALDESDEEDCCSELLEEVDLNQQLSSYTNNGCAGTDSSPEMDDDTLPYLTYFLDQEKVKSGSQVKPSIYHHDQNLPSTTHKAVEIDPKATCNLMDTDDGEERGHYSLLDDASSSHHCSRPCLYVYSGPHIRREACSLEQSPLGESCSLPWHMLCRSFPLVPPSRRNLVL